MSALKNKMINTVYQASCIIDTSDEDLVTEQLFARGATSVSSEKNDRNMIKLTAIFDRKPNLTGLHLQHWYIIERLHEHSWKNLWARNYQGSEINANIQILPYNSKTTVEPTHPVTILLNPRKAFGDGNHATTFLCLNAIDNYLRSFTEKERAEMDILDIGTGTGILAIACALMGVRSVNAFDIDPDAVDSARFNGNLNKCHNITFSIGDISSFKSDKTYSMVLANILTRDIQKNFNTLLHLTSSQGILIISGISSQWHAEMLELFITQRVSLREHTAKDDWNCYVIAKEG